MNAAGPARRGELTIIIGTIGLGVAVFAWRYLPFLSDSRELIGTDYAYFLPHLLAGNYWFAKNGFFSVPWATPAFCGGVPFYPNPQSLYYSPTQWLSFAFGPLSAVRISFVLYAVAGAAGMAWLARQTFGSSVWASALAAVIFLFNGFYSHRMLVGHLAFAPFMLTPIAAAVLLKHRGWVANGLVAGVLFAWMIQAGMVVLFVPMLLVVLWAGLLSAGGMREFLSALALALGSAACLCAAKLVSAAAYLGQFPRDFHTIPGVPSVSVLLSIVGQVLFWHSDTSIGKEFAKSRVIMGGHEWEYGLGPAALCVLLIAAGVRFMSPKPSSPWNWRKTALWVVFAIPLAVNFYSPGWNSFLHALPLLGQNHSLSRWFAFYVPVISLATALAFDAIPFDGFMRHGAAFAGVLAMAATVGFHVVEDENTAGNPHAPDSRYRPALIHDAWTMFPSTGVPAIDRVAPLMTDGYPNMTEGDSLLGEGVSDLICYEPLFGYSLQKFPMGALHEGPALELRDGRLNLKNPACFVYPQENQCARGDEFTEAQMKTAHAFAAYRPVTWKEPLIQKLANAVNVLALFALPAALVLLRRRARLANLRA